MKKLKFILYEAQFERLKKEICLMCVDIYILKYKNGKWITTQLKPFEGHTKEN